MNKSELISAIAKKSDSTLVATEKFLDSFQELIMDTVASGDAVRLMGFGAWECSERSAREGRNPQTGEAIQIEGKNVPKFRPGKEFKDRVAGK